MAPQTPARLVDSMRPRSRIRPPRTVAVELEGATIMVRPLTGLQVQRIIEPDEAQPPMTGAQLLVYAFVCGVCEADGARLYADDETDQALEAEAWDDIEKVAEKVLEISGIDTGDEEQEPVGNGSEGAPSAGSSAS